MSGLPRRCHKYLTEKGLDFREVSDGGALGIIIDHWKLPEGKFDHDEVSLLLLLPMGYPDAAPDMFYLFPWIKVRDAHDWPYAANVGQSFLNQSWQRWSRHWHDWRPGKDGVQTWLTKVRYALEVVR